MRKRILFDTYVLEDLYTKGYLTGVGRTTYELISALCKIKDLPFDLVLYSQNFKGIRILNKDFSLKSIHFYVPRRNPYNSLLNRLKLKKLITRYTFFHIPHNIDTRFFPEILKQTIYTEHDEFGCRSAKKLEDIKVEIGKRKIIANGCRAMVTCSEASKNDIINYLGCPPEKISVIPWGCNRKIFTSNYNKITNIDGLSDDFFFSAACNAPRKQPELMVEAFNEYINSGGKSQFVILNAPSKLREKYHSLITSGKLFMLYDIDDNTLVKLYSQAKASIIVSQYEGFGLPIIESLACHTQVICANNTSLPEAGGNVVDYLDDNSAECLTQKLLQYDMLNKHETLDIENAEKHISKFTWENCARQYIDFWQNQLK